MSILVPPSGPVPARVMLVGEAPGEEEERYLQPFVGPSGQELDRMLREAGIMRSECFVTNLCKERPLHNDMNNFIAKSKKDITPEHRLLREKWVKRPVMDGFKLLISELEAVKPNIVIPLGNYAMWALTGRLGILKWRGSMLNIDTEEMKRCL